MRANCTACLFSHTWYYSFQWLSFANPPNSPRTIPIMRWCTQKSMHVANWAWSPDHGSLSAYVPQFNPHGYRFCGLQGPAFVSFGKISISPSLQTMGESWILSRNQKNASFREQIRKLGTWGGSGAATKLQSRANWKKTDFFFPLQALEEHNSQATSIQNLGIFFLVVYYMPNLSSK